VESHSYYPSGVVTEKGNYSVNGGKIIATNILQSYEGQAKPNYTNEKMPDEEWTFTISEGTKDNLRTEGFPVLKITKWSGVVPFDFVKPIDKDKINGVERWAEGLPSYLYPSGFKGMVFCTLYYSYKDIPNKISNREYFEFYVHIYNVSNKQALQPYFNQLLSNGFTLEKYNEDSAWKAIELNGVRYEVNVQRSTVGTPANQVNLEFCFHRYDSPMFIE
jgi:hypothetical protein